MAEVARSSWSELRGDVKFRSPEGFDITVAAGILQRAFLRSQAEVIKGLLAVIENELGRLEAASTPPVAGEKIPIT
jgi:hypothetical protein